MVHANGGWLLTVANDVAGNRDHALTWGIRADLAVPGLAERLLVIGEVFGQDGSRPEQQLGVRAVLIPGRLQADLSWGWHSGAGQQGVGWAVGLAWTPPPFR